jgi:hypothetical protein
MRTSNGVRLFSANFFAAFRRLAWVFLFTAAASASAVTRTYADNGDGTVTDSSTGLIWMRCSMGQTWNGATCDGVASSYTWGQSTSLTTNFSGQSDWRLPNIAELASLADPTRSSPAIDTSVFPNTPASTYWSASGFAGSAVSAWFVNFSFGTANATSTSQPCLVRLVRTGGAVNSLWNPAKPDADYIDHGDGTVTHAPTGLMWQRCSKGQVWSGGTCTGSAATYIADQATLQTDTYAGQSDWRLPTIAELATLVDYTTTSNPLNATLFPATPKTSFWSSSAYVSNASYAWTVSFSYGGSSGSPKSIAYPVRLVRVAPVAATLALAVSKVGSGVVSSAPAGINCGANCTADFAEGVQVSLSATAAPGSTFAGWSGDCTGAGACTVRMNATRSVTATFTAVPFTIAATGVVDGVVTGSIANVATSISFGAGDVGKTGSVFVTAVVPESFLASRMVVHAVRKKIASTAQSAPAPTLFVLVQLTPTGWQPVVNGQLIPYASGVLGDQLAAQTILSNASTADLLGSQFCVGYGTDATEMIAAGKMHLVAIIPDPNASATASLSCLVSASVLVPKGWSLLGNSKDQGFEVSSLYRDASWVTSVWKWDAVLRRWQFYAPNLDAAALQAHASQNNYGVLSDIKPGEGYWVNALSAASVTLPSGAPLGLFATNLVSGWNLVTSGTSLTAAAVNSAVGASLTSLWAWDSASSTYYFYAPSLQALGGSTLRDYINSKGYLDFTTTAKTLGNGAGFWVNMQ